MRWVGGSLPLPWPVLRRVRLLPPSFFHKKKEPRKRGSFVIYNYREIRVCSILRFLQLGLLPLLVLPQPLELLQVLLSCQDRSAIRRRPNHL